MEKELENYPLIPINEIDPVAREISVRWHENATGWIGDKHKLASDIMNYGKNRVKDSAAPDLLEALDIVQNAVKNMPMNNYLDRIVLNIITDAITKALTPIK